jgi:hypothetical protein
MKNYFKLKFKNLFILIISTSFFAVSSFAQLPQYYNYSGSGANNGLPFGITEGMRTEWLIGPGEFNQPSPAPAGHITKLWFRVGSSTQGSGTYTNLTITLGQDSINGLPNNQFYNGQLDTVYFRSSATITAPPNAFIAFVLDTVFDYNPALSLIIDVMQCGKTGGFTLSTHNLLGSRVSWSYAGPCNQNWFAYWNWVPHCGIDIIPLTEIISNNGQIPDIYVLDQNYPNPFNPVTKIKFSLPVSSNVKLIVYDITGKEVQTLVNDFLNSGSYDIKFDGTNLPSGLYFYRLITGNYSETKKMLMVK